ncbi:N-acetylmuramoyl-L-alanine amidase domain-containing protein SAOUHSC_02979-like [Macrobrachium rosenbergii]|uniref:N-acetylmuramoyl-L-alanine amidase domain-containing protein SAOUHSC_02979-like n=1 Tax=Macrobrachium rosenbergii TaxID=79674 RepID=UPI0034D472B9
MSMARGAMSASFPAMATTDPVVIYGLYIDSSTFLLFSCSTNTTSPVTRPVNHSETNSSDVEKSTEVNNPDLDTHNALTSSTENLIDKNNHNKKRKVIDRTPPRVKNLTFSSQIDLAKPVLPINRKQITLTASQVEIHSVPQSKTNINNDSPNMDKSSNSSVLSSPKSMKKSLIKHPTEKSKTPKIHQITTTSNQPSTRLKNSNNNKPKNSNKNFIPAHRRSNIPIPEIPNKNISTSSNGNIIGTQRFRKCPSTFHQDGEQCSESLKLKKNMIKTQIDLLIRKYEEEPINASDIQQSNLAAKKPQSNTNSLKM